MDKGTHQNLISVAIIDDDANVRSGVAWLLNISAGFRCLGAYADCSAALPAIKQAPPDVLLLDVNLPAASGIDCIPLIRQHHPAMKIIMHSNYDDEDKIARSRQAGAAGYVLKNSPVEALCHAIRTVYAGGMLWPDGDDASLATGLDAAKPAWLLRALRSVFGV